MGKFKINDSVTVIKDYTVSKKYTGYTGIIKNVHTRNLYPYEVKFSDCWDIFNEEELDHSKEHKVLTILREYEKNRKVLQRQSRG